jgi:hypothetical protein
MPTPSDVFTEMVTTTLRNHPKAISDNVSKNNALYARLSRRGNIRTVSGGYEIVQPLDYAENSTYQRYSGYDTLNVSASDVLTAARYDWCQAAIHVTASGRELRMNSGREQLISLAEARIKNAMRTGANNMSLDLYSDGALPNQMGGLAHIIQTNGQGTVGGINSTTWAFWRNQFREAAGTNTISKATIKGEMNLVWLSCVRGGDRPDLIVASHDFFSMYWESLQDLQRFTSTDSAEAGFTSLKYVTADVIFDDNANFTKTAERMYFLNTDYLQIVAHTDANWSVEDEKVSVNQDAVVIPVLWMGNLVCSNRSLQGILIDAT